MQGFARYCRVALQDIAGSFCRVLQKFRVACRVLQGIAGSCCRVLQGMAGVWFAGYCKVVSQGTAGSLARVLQGIAGSCCRVWQVSGLRGIAGFCRAVESALHGGGFSGHCKGVRRGPGDRVGRGVVIKHAGETL